MSVNGQVVSAIAGGIRRVVDAIIEQTQRQWCYRYESRIAWSIASGIMTVLPCEGILVADVNSIVLLVCGINRQIKNRRRWCDSRYA